MLKWPRSVSMIRHGRTVYNDHPIEQVEGYDKFKEKFEEELAALTPVSYARKLFPSPELREMAIQILEKYYPDFADFDTRLTDVGWKQARVTGERLPEVIPRPNIIYFSPYRRTRETLEGIMEGWPELKNVKRVEDDRIREREHGKAAVYGDWRILNVFNPQYALLFKISKSYEFRQENGENMLDVRERNRSIIGTFIREHGGMPQTFKDQVIGNIRDYSRGGILSMGMDLLGIEADTVPENVMMVTHSLTILGMRSVFERWDRERFLQEHKNNFPDNCSVTIYRGVESDPGRSRQGKHGRMIMSPDEYNMKLY